MPGGPTIDEQRGELVDWRRRLDPGSPIELVETHISIVVLQGDRVYKLKKNVALPFVDLSTPELRLRDCEREFARNRRFAPDVYLGVLPVTDAGGRVVDHVVAMRRMPEDRRLALLARAGDDRVSHCLDLLARDIARVHEAAARGPEIDAAATRDSVAAAWERELGELEHRAGLLGDAPYRDIRALALRYLAGRRELFDLRIAGGHVCDGHGDLLADDIFCTNAGPKVLDCVAFDDRLCWTDTLADVSFLAMDLERLGRPELARHFLERYAAEANDDWPASLEAQYIAYRAVVRAKVACVRHEQGRQGALERARSLLDLAHRQLRRGRVRLVLVGGTPGTGKSTLARGLGAATGWPVVRSDVVRKQIAGLGELDDAAVPLDTGLYRADVTTRVYDTLLEAAATKLALGSSVILDASWSSAASRQRAVAVTDRTASDVICLRCDAPEPIALARVAERRRARNDASDADAGIVVASRARFEPWDGAITIDTTAATADSVASAWHAVDAP